MVRFTIASALAALATFAPTTTASPLGSTTILQRSNTDALPLTKSYRLYINVTHPALDFPSNPVHGQYAATVRAGATLNALTVTNVSSSASRFSTTNHSTTQLSESLAANFTLGAYSIYMADAATPVEPNQHVLNLGVNGGNGTEGIYTSGSECTTLQTAKVGTFAVCDEKFDAYTHPRWLLVFVEGGEMNLPGDCVAVSLVPECDAYDPRPGVSAGDDGIVEARCWADVKSVVNWGDYGC